MQKIQQSRVTEWVQLCEQWCEPEWTHWCDGSPGELPPSSVQEETVHSDAAQVPLTPTAAITQIARECRGSFRGRTMFVVPYLEDTNAAGVLVTDSASYAARHCQTVRIGVDLPDTVDDDYVFTATLCLSAEAGTVRQICCQLTGLASLDTQCRTNPTRKYLGLPLQTLPTFAAGGERCLDCARLCANRARAILASTPKSV